MKSLCVVVLGALMILGLGTAVVAQTTDSASPQAATSAPAEPAAKPFEDKEAGPASSSATSPDQHKPDASTGISASDPAAGADVSASPRTEPAGTRIFGVDPTTAALIAAGFLILAIVALVAIAHGGRAAEFPIDDDLNRNRRI